ncbi:MAG TPA: NAD(P)H-binding protein [Bryobacteraceae bacterium]
MYLVTGATGNVGSEVASQLLERGGQVRAFTRHPEKLGTWSKRADVVKGDFQNPDTLARAMEGVDAVFLMSQGPDVESFRQIVQAIKAAGGNRVVFLSSILAGEPEYEIGRMHLAKEEAIREAGLNGKFLRATGFMTNSYQWIETIQEQGKVFNALGDAKFPPIAGEDIAAVAIRALTDPKLSGEVFELTGGELISVRDEVKILGKILGRELQCIDIPVEVAVQNMVRSGLPQKMAEAVGQSLGSLRNGRSAVVLNTVEKVTGRAPITYETWARKHAAQFASTLAHSG